MRTDHGLTVNFPVYSCVPERVGVQVTAGAALTARADEPKPDAAQRERRGVGVADDDPHGTNYGSVEHGLKDAPETVRQARLRRWQAER